MTSLATSRTRPSRRWQRPPRRASTTYGAWPPSTRTSGSPPPAERIVEVCWGPDMPPGGGHRGPAAGFQEELGLTDEGETSDNKVTLKYNTCLGACSQAPVMSVDHHLTGPRHGGHGRGDGRPAQGTAAAAMNTFTELRQRADEHWQGLVAGDRPWIRVGTAMCGHAAGAVGGARRAPQRAGRPRCRGQRGRGRLPGALLRRAPRRHPHTRKLAPLLRQRDSRGRPGAHRRLPAVGRRTRP